MSSLLTIVRAMHSMFVRVESDWFLLATTRITIVLSLLWLFHVLAKNRNPRWRVWCWRVGTIGIACVGLLAGADPWFRIDVPDIVPPMARLLVSPTEIATEDTFRHAVPHLPRRSLASLAAGSSAVADAPVPAVAVNPPFYQAMIAVFWVVGCLVISLRWAFAYWRLRAVELRASEVSNSVYQTAQQIAQPLGVPVGRIAETDELAAPSVFGLIKTTILLPTQWASAGEQHDLRAALTHEFLHVQNGDLRWDAWIRWVGLVFWWHPLGWAIRIKHRRACEQLCDLGCVAQLGREAYEANLARISLYANGFKQIGFAMAKSDVIQRLDYLRRGSDAKPLRTRGRLAACCVLLSVIFSSLTTIATPSRALAQTDTVKDRVGVEDERVSAKPAKNDLAAGSERHEANPSDRPRAPRTQDAGIGVNEEEPSRDDAVLVKGNHAHTAIASINGRQVTLQEMPPEPDYAFLNQAYATRAWNFEEGTQLKAKLSRIGITHVSLFQPAGTGLDKNGREKGVTRDVEQTAFSAADQAFLKQVAMIREQADAYDEIYLRRLRDERLRIDIPRLRQRFEQTEQPRVLPCEWQVTKKVLSLSPGAIRVRCNIVFETLQSGAYSFPIRIVSKRSRERFVYPPFSSGIGDAAIRFQVKEDLTVEPLDSSRWGTRSKLAITVAETTIRAQLDISVREDPHSCIVMVQPRHFVTSNVQRPLDPTNAQAMTFEQFLGDQ